MEWMGYMMMDHYGWTLKEVNNMSMSEVKQAVSWAIAMNRKGPETTRGEVVHLGYDRIPSFGGD